MNLDLSMDAAKTYSVYFAGELFSAKHLLGNAVLAEAIRRRSQNLYQPLLPQNLEQRDATAHAIRDQDIRALLSCDLGVFNYDGPELDSGTVVEFMFAKFADIPAVLLRTDFRCGGDQLLGGDPWNLMNSFYPRTRALALNSMAFYQEALLQTQSPDENRNAVAGLSMIERIADEVIRALDELVALPPSMPAGSAEAVYRWLAAMPGFKGAANGVGPVEELSELCAHKRRQGLL
jgi:hypothetical protein